MFVAQDHDDSLIGFIEVSLRSHADGCDPSHPVGFIEGWYVKPVFRGRRIGAKLLREAERWAREACCHENGFRHLGSIILIRSGFTRRSVSRSSTAACTTANSR